MCRNSANKTAGVLRNGLARVQVRLLKALKSVTTTKFHQISSAVACTATLHTVSWRLHALPLLTFCKTAHSTQNTCRSQEGPKVDKSFCTASGGAVGELKRQAMDAAFRAAVESLTGADAPIKVSLLSISTLFCPLFLFEPF